MLVKLFAMLKHLAHESYSNDTWLWFLDADAVITNPKLDPRFQILLQPAVDLERHHLIGAEHAVQPKIHSKDTRCFLAQQMDRYFYPNSGTYLVRVTPQARAMLREWICLVKPVDKSSKLHHLPLTAVRKYVASVAEAFAAEEAGGGHALVGHKKQERLLLRRDKQPSLEKDFGLGKRLDYPNQPGYWAMLQFHCLEAVMLPQRVMNSFPDEGYKDIRQTAAKWLPGDFVAHGYGQANKTVMQWLFPRSS